MNDIVLVVAILQLVQNILQLTWFAHRILSEHKSLFAKRSWAPVKCAGEKYYGSTVDEHGVLIDSERENICIRGFGRRMRNSMRRGR